MTKTKTATLDVYMPRGTSYWTCDVLYRGRLEKEFPKATVPRVTDEASAWCRNQGYTHVKLYGVRIALEPLQTTTKGPA